MQNISLIFHHVIQLFDQYLILILIWSKSYKEHRNNYYYFHLLLQNAIKPNHYFYDYLKIDGINTISPIMSSYLPLYQPLSLKACYLQLGPPCLTILQSSSNIFRDHFLVGSCKNQGLHLRCWINDENTQCS